MKFKPDPLIINPENPFKFDALKREQSIQALTGFIDSINGPFVLAIDSPWGTGKTAFIKMWQAHLEKQDQTTLYFNAWESDFSTDPMVAFVAEISSLMEGFQKENGSYKPHLAKTRKIATALAKRAIPAAIRIGTAGILNLDDFTEEAIGNATAEGAQDAIDLYAAEKSLMKQFHEALNSTIESLKESKKKPTLIIFIDEIDRCRPTYAIDLLERIKHLFNIENAIFVIALDKEQLSVSLKGVYGEGLNASEYLRRFIDVEFNLPSIDTKSFTKNLVSRFSFKDYFDARKGELAYDFESFTDTFNGLASVYDLSLRQREHCFTRIALALKSTPADHYLHPMPLTILTIINIVDKSLYRKFVFGNGTATDVINNISSTSGGKDFITSRLGKLIQGCLIALKINRENETNGELESYNFNANQNANPQIQTNAKEMLEFIQYFSKYKHRGLNIQYIKNKIELAAQLFE
jgi:hypothetical protein